MIFLLSYLEINNKKRVTINLDCSFDEIPYEEYNEKNRTLSKNMVVFNEYKINIENEYDKISLVQHVIIFVNKLY